MSRISIEDMIQVLDMEVLYEGKSLSIDIETSDINRPGLQFAGFFDYFAVERIQVIGKVEMTYLDSMDPDNRKVQLDRFFSSGIPCVLISRNMEIPQYLIE
ncbi:MAG: HPr kinase/phosphorylase, partial [Clostridiales bacterium]|nr:HPr kinase/phosphorylase [Clostridiales bacterium]